MNAAATATRPSPARWRGSFSVLLVLLLVLLFQPLFLSPAASIVFKITFSLITVFGLASVHEQKKYVAVMWVLVVLTFAAQWLHYFYPRPLPFRYASETMVIVFMGFTTALILRKILKEKVVSFDTIAGAIAGYLMVGLMFAAVIRFLETLHPGSFTAANAPLAPVMDVNLSIYYSFIVLATVGFGDIIPATLPARTFAFTEAICGQMYLAVLIAVLVGKHIAQAQNRPEPGSDQDQSARSF